MTFTKALSERKKLLQQLNLRKIDQATYDELSAPFTQVIENKLNELRSKSS